MKVLIIEDEAPAFRRLQKALEKLVPDIEILDVIDTVVGSVAWLKNHSDPDLIFMDIQLSDGISFQIFEQLEIRVPVIFTTAFDEFSLRAFKVNSIDYLLKPIKTTDLEAGLKKFQSLKESFLKQPINLNELIKGINLNSKEYKDRFLVKRGENFLSIPTSSIIYFQTRHGIVNIVTDQKKIYPVNYTLDEVCKLLDPKTFFRANRQFVVNYNAIVKVGKYFKGKLVLEMTKISEEPIIVSAEKASVFKEWLGS